MVNLIRTSELIAKLKVSRTTLWRLTNDEANDFPPKINISNRLVGYDESLVEEWLTKQTANKKQ